MTIRDVFVVSSTLFTAFVLLNYVLPAPGWARRLETNLVIRKAARERHRKIRRENPEWRPRHA